MNIEELRESTCAHLKLLAPRIEDTMFLVDACFKDAKKYFRDEFICLINPQAWARITLIYHKHFLDSGNDISLAEIITAVISDSINTKRMDMVTLQLSQYKGFQQENNRKTPSLKIVKE
ncbi:MAG: hypothetical protein HND53_05500 [Proteobacteria bacterium]|nr:hypothetical protein [Pseudomonadota bacterium]NOG59937.1 hypothetical protein [Pseudomonadota bacterium]